jgi:transposase
MFAPRVKFAYLDVLHCYLQRLEKRREPKRSTASIAATSGRTLGHSERALRKTIEACASSHHWSRELKTLGHTVRLMPPAYVKPYVKRQKNDVADAEAICEAVTRANMRFVATKTPEQQSCLTLHRTRHLFIRQQTAVINVIRAHLAEFGIVAPVGRKGYRGAA